MAKSRAYRWNGWRTDFAGGGIKDRPVKRQKQKRKPKGITNAQSKYLADLQRKAGEPYSGRGMTSAEASREIKRLTGKERAPGNR